MQIRELKIRNFRGIASLDWKPAASFCCVIGPGDAGKSTLLDAIEATLSSRWISFSEPDFLNCGTANPISVDVTIGELSKALKSDERFGLYVRGWTVDGNLRDEPEGDDEPVLTVRLTVDATMEPVWELVCERADEPRTLSNRDRALFGVIRLAGDDARHLAWGQGSVLARLTGETDEASARLADAYRAARASAKLHEIKELAETAARAEAFAIGLGAYVEGGYAPGLELGRSGLSSGSIALHDNGVPLRLAGLGSRRLATLAIQKSAIAEGAIVLVDEVEHGLEPHRIAGAIAQLKADQTDARTHGRSMGQVLVTTHSDVAVSEAGAECLRVVQVSRPGRLTTVNRPRSPDDLHPLLRFAPRALFARRVLVTEGNTEVGLLLGLRQYWPARHAGKPIEQIGTAIVDGNGAQACSLALTLHSLGYVTGLFRDSDEELEAAVFAELGAAAIPVFEYGGGLNTEQAIFSAASDNIVQELIDLAREERGSDSVDAALKNQLPDIDLEVIRGPFAAWPTPDGVQLRAMIASVALRKRWFKDQRIARRLAPPVWRLSNEAPTAPVTVALAHTESWLYA